MSLLEAFVYGIVQGITQFLPLSSSGHRIVVPWLLQWPEPSLAIHVTVISGTTLALLLCFGGEGWRIVRGGAASIIERRVGFDGDRILFWKLLVAVVPSLVAGLFFQNLQELKAPLMVAIFLAAGGFLIYWIDGRYGAVKTLDELRGRDAFAIGCAGAIGLIPGVSLMGAAIILARWLGLGREASVRFCLLLLLPISCSYTAFLWWRLTLEPGISLPLQALLTGMAVAGVTGVVVIQSLIGFVRSSSLAYFGIYRIALAGVIVIWSLIMG